MKKNTKKKHKNTKNLKEKKTLSDFVIKQGILLVFIKML